ncbi:MAG: type II toxin-antitoxin system HicB family antitoxin [Firmicutes bacterium]|nr:type II toxin-antitoxin system HicB family antitoxin [Bacillota bacterium]
MKFMYSAILQPQPDGSYTGYFPDLEDCRFAGRNLIEALDEAKEAAGAWIMVELEENDGLPPNTDHDEMHLAPGEFVRDIAVILRLTDGWDE